MQRTPRTRASTVATVLAALMLSTSGLALASVNVSTSLEEGDRDIEVTDLSNNELTDLALASGVPKTFRVAVVDTRLNSAQQMDFSVDATMNNLYRVDGEGHDFDTAIPSDQISVSYATDPLGVDNLLADVSPAFLLETTQALSCELLASELGLTLSDLLNLLGLGGLDLCADIAGLEFSDVPVIGETLGDVDFGSLDLASLPLVPSTGDTGAFTVADYDNGIGLGDDAPAGYTGGTVRRLLLGRMNSDALTALTGLVDDLLVDTPLAGTGESLVAATATVEALRESGVAEVKALGDILASLDEGQQIAVINEFLTGVLDTLGVDDILALTGTYQSLPRLTVDTGEAVGGTYEGTLTITLMNHPDGLPE